MTEVVVTRNSEGKIEGLSESHQKSWLKLWAHIKALTAGEVLYIEFWFPRSGKKHRFHFMLLHRLFGMQEVFSDLDEMRWWLQLRAGIVIWVAGPEGPVAIPKSVKFSRMDNEEFDRYHDAMVKTMWDVSTQAFLWPHLPEQSAWEMMEIAVNGGQG